MICLRKKNSCKEGMNLRKLILLLLTCAVLASCALAADYTVDRLAVKAVVEDKGLSSMTHTVELTVNTPVEEIVLPVGRDVKRAALSGVSGKIFRSDGAAYARIKPGEEFTGKLTAVITFERQGLLEPVEAGQQFTLELCSDLYTQQVGRFSFSAALPKELEALPSFFSSYRADDVEDDLTTAMQGIAVSGQLRGGLLDHEAFTLQATVPEGFFAVKTAAPAQREPGSVLMWICSILGTLVAAAAVYYWVRFLRSGSLKQQARTLPPEGLSPAEVPMLLASGKPEFALLVCHWGALGYLTVTRNGGGRVLLRKSMEMGTERREEEKQLFDMLFDASDVAEAGGSRYSRTAEAAASLLKRYWVRRLYDRASGSPMLLQAAAVLVCALGMMTTMAVILPPSGVKWLLLLIAFVAGGACGTAVLRGCIRFGVRDCLSIGLGAGALVMMYLMARFGGGMYLMLLAILLAVFAGLMTRFGGQRTASGSDMLEQTRGFCRFLTHAEDLHLTQMLENDGQFFYSMVLYAAACGQGRRFARRFDGLKMDACAFVTMAGEAPAGASEWYRQFEGLLKAMKA